MSSDFEGYEQDFAVLTAEITSKISRVPRLPPGEYPARPGGGGLESRERRSADWASWSSWRGLVWAVLASPGGGVSRLRTCFHAQSHTPPPHGNQGAGVEFLPNDSESLEMLLCILIPPPQEIIK